MWQDRCKPCKILNQITLKFTIMKNLILILSMISMFLFSCGTQNEGKLSDEEKEKIKSEISPLFNQIVQNSEAGNLKKAIEPYSNKTEFVSISNGQVSDYDKFVEGNKQYFETMKSQKFTETLMNYTFVSRETVIVTWGGSATIKLKDGKQLKVDPFAASLVFNRTNGIWKVIYNHESGVFTPIINDSIKTD
ncbi:hypothetical protein E9993_14870 [Labilibacter sediminis]|nr:hypothetical protein E9993_14870 [Labilibacter sediminis]